METKPEAKAVTELDVAKNIADRFNQNALYETLHYIGDFDPRNKFEDTKRRLLYVTNQGSGFQLTVVEVDVNEAEETAEVNIIKFTSAVSYKLASEASYKLSLGTETEILAITALTTYDYKKAAATSCTHHYSKIKYQGKVKTNQHETDELLKQYSKYHFALDDALENNIKLLTEKIGKQHIPMMEGVRKVAEYIDGLEGRATTTKLSDIVASRVTRSKGDKAALAATGVPSPKKVDSAKAEKAHQVNGKSH